MGKGIVQVVLPDGCIYLCDLDAKTVRLVSDIINPSTLSVEVRDTLQTLGALLEKQAGNEKKE